MREGNFNRVERAERVEKGVGVSSQELESGEVIAHAKSAKFAKSDVGNVLTQRHKGTESWPMVRLGDVCEVINGLWKGTKEPLVNVGVIRATNFTKQCEFDVTKTVFIDVEEKKFLKRKLQFGDIIVERSGGGPNQPVGRVIYFDQKDGNYSLSNFTSALRVKNSIDLDPYFLYRVLVACYVTGVTEKMQSNSVQLRNIDFERYLNIQILLPPLSVQMEIVERLEKELGEADKVAAEFKRMVELADKEFKAELDETFGGLGEKGLGVSSQELGLAAKNAKGAKDWPMVRLGEIAAINGGFAFKSANYTSNGVRVIRISDFNESGFVNNKIVRHPYDDALKPYILELKDILLCMTGGTVGKCLFVTQMEEVMVVNQRVATIKVKNDMPKYVYWVLSSSITQRVVQYSKNSLNDNISLDTIKGFLIPLPPIEVQNEIVAKLDVAKERCEKLKAEAERGLRAAENLRKAILSEAFE